MNNGFKGFPGPLTTEEGMGLRVSGGSYSSTASTWVAMSFNTVIVNNLGAGAWNPLTPTRLIAPHSGWFLLFGSYARNASTDITHLISFGTNGSVANQYGNMSRHTGGNNAEEFMAAPIYLAKNNYVEVYTYWYSTTTIDASYAALVALGGQSIMSQYR